MQPVLEFVMLGSDRDKHRLETTRGKGIFEGRLQRTKVLGASTATPDSEQLFEEFQRQRFNKGAHTQK